MTRRALYPGSFDPLTRGHLDLIARGLELFDELVVGIGVNSAKTPLFTIEERVDIIRRNVPSAAPVRVVPFTGLVVHCAEKEGCRTLLRGLRTISDFEYEYQMALTNRTLAPTVETVFVMPSEKWFYISSRLIKEVFSMGGDVSEFLPDDIVDEVKRRLTPKDQPR